MLSTMEMMGPTDPEQLVEAAAHAEKILGERVRVLCVYAREWHRRAREAKRLGFSKAVERAVGERNVWLARARNAKEAS